ncbi:MAG: hypothetical protein J2P25_07355 [Nocardiopsaceae bacterium]|nr:hypothetical protein [Nocardiopsaceae bacterium]
MMYLRGFLPWIVLAVVSSFAGQGTAMAAALVTCLLVLAARGRATRTDLLGLATLGYFAVMTAVAFAAPHAIPDSWTGPLSIGVLGLVSWVSLAVRQPFTLHFARQQTSSEFWNHPVFYRINAVITAVWAASFTLTAIAYAAAEAVASRPTALEIVLEVAGFAIPALFTARYPQHARARLTTDAKA